MANVYVLLGIIGNITAMVMFMSPTPTVWRIINSRDTGSFSPVPYACTLLNCLLWFFYGLPAVTSNNTLIVTINSAGIILECIYLIIFFTIFSNYVVSPGISEHAAGWGRGIFCRCHRSYTHSLPTGRTSQIRRCSVCRRRDPHVRLATFSTQKLVIATRSVEYMPFSLSLCSLINALLWTSYGVLKHDKFLIIPNTIGAILGLLQLAIYSHFQREDDEAFHKLPEYSGSKLRHSRSSNSYLQ